MRKIDKSSNKKFCVTMWCHRVMCPIPSDFIRLLSGSPHSIAPFFAYSFFYVQICAPRNEFVELFMWKRFSSQTNNQPFPYNNTTEETAIFEILSITSIYHWIRLKNTARKCCLYRILQSQFASVDVETRNLGLLFSPRQIGVLCNIF